MMRIARTSTLGWAALAIVGVAISGCASGAGPLGYSGEPPFPQDVATVAVPIFENKTFERGVEFELTEALIKEIELRTPYKVVRQGTADTVIEGTVVSANRRLFSRTPDAAVPQEVQFAVTARFQWKDLRSGEVLARRGRITGSGEFVPTRPVGETYETAQHGAVSELARDMVGIMRSDW
jgi:hypothetical protein